jgi:hypothetical protein
MEDKDPEKTTDLTQLTDKLYDIMLYTSPWSRFELTTPVVIGTDCIGSYKSNYHTIMAMTAPVIQLKILHIHFSQSIDTSLHDVGSPFLACNWDIVESRMKHT